MVYSIHTFELTRSIEHKMFQKLKNAAYKNSKGRHRMYQDKKRTDVYIDSALAGDGIKIEYHDGVYKKTIKLIINPTKVLGGNDIKNFGNPTTGTS